MYKTSIIGNLGRDAAIRRTESSTFISFSVAVTINNKTIWFDCTIDGERPNLLPYLVKGTKVYCYGSQTSKIYKDGHGINQISHNLYVNQLELCGSAKQETTMPDNQENNNPF